MDINRRSFLGAAGATGLLVISVRNSGVANGAPTNGPVTIQHRFGQTTIPEPPRRVVSAGFTEQDDLLAVGVVPVAVTTWWGDEPFEVWPWAQPRLGSAQPQVLSFYDGGFQYDRIAALQPDLIVADHRRRGSGQLQPVLGDRANDPTVGRCTILRAVEDAGHHHRPSDIPA